MLVWVCLYLLAFSAGGWSAGKWPAGVGEPRRPPSPNLQRGAILLPLLLAGANHPVAVLAVWGVTAVGAVWVGRQECVARQSRIHAQAAAAWEPSRRCGWQGRATVRFSAWPQHRSEGWTCAAVIVALGPCTETGAVVAPRVGDGILLKGKGPPPVLWSLVAGSVAATAPAGATIPGGFDYARYLAGRNLLWLGKMTDYSPLAAPLSGGPAFDPLRWGARHLLQPLRERIFTELRAGMPSPESSLVGAILLGQRDEIGNRARQPFTQLGLAHLFAVSGLHVGILLGILALLTRRLTLGPGWRLLPVLLFLPGYVILTGMSGSVLRAASLATLILAAPYFGRRCQPLTALGVLFWINLQLAPWSILDTGCRLSYLAAGGIVAVNRLTQPLLPTKPGWWRWLLTALLVTLSAQWFTLPEIIGSFGWLHPGASLANLVAVPAFALSVWFAVLGLVAGIAWPWLGEALLANCWLLLRCLGVGAGQVARTIPTLGIAPLGPWRLLGFVVLSGCLLRLLHRWRSNDVVTHWRRRGLLGCLLAGLVLLLPLGRDGRSGRMLVYQFDVGQGDCALLHFPDQSRLLIDLGPGWTGGSAVTWSVLPWLRRHGIRHLDGVVLTHDHADHIGGLDDLLSSISVGSWWLGGGTWQHFAARFPEADIRQPVVGQQVHRSGEWVLLCLHAPTDSESSETENDRSVVLALQRGERVVGLWGGDLELAGEAALLAGSPPHLENRLQVWKAGHHGSSTSGGEPFLAWSRPRLVLVSCGVENRHDHPSHGPYLASGDTVPIIRTDLDGSVRLTWETDGRLAWSCGRGKHGRVTP
ncbi:MAG: DNA internalization-related competence protein ComEC/Rec2 [bacterium]